MNRLLRRLSIDSVKHFNSGDSAETPAIPENKEKVDANVTEAEGRETENTLDEAEREHDTEFVDPCKGLSFRVGVSENKNPKYRRTMEDVHTYVANFCERLDWGYFAVFDGHAGKQTARWAGSNLHNLLYESIMKGNNGDLRDHLNESFLKADEEISRMDDVGSSGCTAAVAVLRWEEEVEEAESELEGDVSNGDVRVEENAEGENSEVEDEEEEEEEKEEEEAAQFRVHSEETGIRETQNRLFDFVPGRKHKRILYTANVGDSRIVLNRGHGRYQRLSYEHKGTDRSEIKRIHRQGGIVLSGRVNGVLAVSRSLGDVYLKEYVLGAPYTTMTEITPDDRQLIIACDGLWDVCDDETAVRMIDGIRDSDRAAKVLCEYALKCGTGDNVTVMVVNLDERVFGVE